MKNGRKMKKYEKTNPPPASKQEEEGNQLVKGGDLLGHIDQLLKEAEAVVNKKKPKGWEDKGTCNC